MFLDPWQSHQIFISNLFLYSWYCRFTSLKQPVLVSIYELEARSSVKQFFLRKIYFPFLDSCVWHVPQEVLSFTIIFEIMPDKIEPKGKYILNLTEAQLELVSVSRRK